MYKYQFRWITSITFSIVFLLVIVSGCNFRAPTDTPTPEANPELTSAAKTIEAQADQITAQAASLTAQFNTQPQETQPQEPPPEETLPQEPPVEVTPTDKSPSPDGALPITASVETNCRQGPSTDYPRLGYLPVGQKSYAHGRDPSKNWWYITNPQKPDQYCWVWAQTTHVEGDVDMLPVVQPPPPPQPKTPPPQYEAAFSNIHACGGVGVFIFRIGNSGDIPLQSMRLSVRDMSNDKVIGSAVVSNNPFMAAPNGCPPGSEKFPPQTIFFVGIPVTSIAQQGAQASASLTLCTENDLKGECLDKKIDFKIP